MSKRSRSYIILLALIALIAFTFHAASRLRQAQITDIEAEVSAIRRLERLGETTMQFVTRAQITQERAGTDEEEASAPDDDMERLTAFYRALDLTPPDLDLAESFREFYTANVAGFFDFDTEQITLLRQPGKQFAPLDYFERLLYAHEFMHVLQDQHYDLEQVWERVGKDASFDQALATNALIEGEAETIERKMIDRQLRHISDRELEYLIRQLERAETTAPPAPRVPAVIQAAFIFPYEEGIKFVSSLVDNAGWEAVDEAYANDPPQSTEQIYHPERYLAGEAPIDLFPQDISHIIGDGWRQRYDNAVGEFYLRQHLLTHLETTAAITAAAGWGGDRLQIFTNNASDDMLWVWNQVWDSSEDTEEFAAEYRRFLDLRYDWVDSDERCWSGETTHCVARYSSVETRITMASDEATARALLASQG